MKTLIAVLPSTGLGFGDDVTLWYEVAYGLYWSYWALAVNPKLNYLNSSLSWAFPAAPT